MIYPFTLKAGEGIKSDVWLGKKWPKLEKSM